MKKTDFNNEHTWIYDDDSFDSEKLADPIKKAEVRNNYSFLDFCFSSITISNSFFGHRTSGSSYLRS